MNKEQFLNREFVDNKTEVPMSHYLENFANLDPNETASRCNVEYDEISKAFILTVLGVPIKVSWPSCEIILPKDHELSDVFDNPYMKLLIIRYLTELCSAPFSGEFKTYREMPWGEVYVQNFNGRCIMRLAYGFGFKIDNFCSACEKIGGRKLTLGDASYEIPVFENMLIRLVLYTGDDEFPPTSQWLFSDNMVVFTAEDRAVFGDLLINALKTLS